MENPETFSLTVDVSVDQLVEEKDRLFLDNYWNFDSFVEMIADYLVEVVSIFHLISNNPDRF